MRIPYAAWVVGKDQPIEITCEEHTPNGTGDGREIWAIDEASLRDSNARSTGDGEAWNAPQANSTDPDGNGLGVGVYAANAGGDGGYGLHTASMKALKRVILGDEDQNP